MTPHVIRLRGPWGYEVLGRYTLGTGGRRELVTVDLPPGGTIRLPGDWPESIPPDFHGAIRFTRWFSRPTGLEGGERVWLRIHSAVWPQAVWLNGRQLRPFESSSSRSSSSRPEELRLEITDDLKPRNVIAVDLDVQTRSTDQRLSLPLEVALEIGP